MRVLLVDDDPTAQKVMKQFLERSGYQPIVTSTGQKAIALATSDDPPPIAIIDWMMPGLDGPTVCRALRASKLKVRPYLFLFSSKSNKDEIAQGLDAGADDFINKPFNVAELQARLRVACRTIQYQMELQKQIDDITSLQQSNTLLREYIGSKREDEEEPEKPATEKLKPAVIAPPTSQLSVQDIRYLITSSFLQLRLAVEAFTAHRTPIKSPTSGWQAWSGLLTQTGAWFDIIVGVENESAIWLFERTFGRRPNAESDLRLYVAELPQMIATALSRTLVSRGLKNSQPLMARSQNLDVTKTSISFPTEAKHFSITVDGLPVTLVMARQESCLLEIDPNQFVESDVLAEQYPPRSVSEVPLLKEGVVLTAHLIDKLLHQVDMTTNIETSRIFRPSQLAKLFANTGASAK